MPPTTYSHTTFTQATGDGEVSFKVGYNCKSLCAGLPHSTSIVYSKLRMPHPAFLCTYTDTTIIDIYRLNSPLWWAFWHLENWLSLSLWSDDFSTMFYCNCICCKECFSIFRSAFIGKLLLAWYSLPLWQFDSHPKQCSNKGCTKSFFLFKKKKENRLWAICIFSAVGSGWVRCNLRDI